MIAERALQNRDRIYVAGQWVEPATDVRIPIINPSTEEPLGWVPGASRDDIAKAVVAARAALPGWARTPMAERAAALERIADGLEARVEEIARTVSSEVGTPIARSREWQAQQPVTVTRLYAELARASSTDETIGNSLVVRDPVGVVACIVPWNFPLHQTMLKVAPALAAGCTVVLKPSTLAPLTAFILAEVIDAAGLPAGVFNLITGTGQAAGEALAAHRDVDMISLTGSTAAGERVAAIAAQSIKRLTLELGGKSASIVLDDADLEEAVAATVHNCYANAGQTCAAWTRLLVPRRRQSRAEAVARETAEGYVLGDPLVPLVTMGPLISTQQREAVRRYIDKGIAEGARLLTGGGDPPDFARGFFVKPTVFADVTSDMTIAREEIFGPVLVIEPYDTDEDAVTIANATPYGLSGAVWSADRAHALEIARQMQTGQVFINGAAFNYRAPFGGYKQSGLGREFGRFGLDEYLELKAIQMPA